jgi:colanic acid biosynthesis protein WcaH
MRSGDRAAGRAELGDSTARLSAVDFEAVVRLAPLISIDLIVRSAGADILLGYRRNEPARGTWFVPGGRIRKNERLEVAFARTVKDELGVELSAEQARFFGVFEHIYDENFAQRAGFGTHYVVLAYEISLARLPDTLQQDQHDSFRWFTLAEVLQRPDVHPYTRAYFTAR